MDKYKRPFTTKDERRISRLLSVLALQLIGLQLNNTEVVCVQLWLFPL